MTRAGHSHCERAERTTVCCGHLSNSRWGQLAPNPTTVNNARPTAGWGIEQGTDRERRIVARDRIRSPGERLAGVDELRAAEETKQYTEREAKPADTVPV